MSKVKLTIYHDPSMITKHNPKFGSPENGDRVKIDVDKYKQMGCQIQSPNPKPAYLKLLKEMHDNPTLDHLSKSKRNNLCSILSRFRQQTQLLRNCHGCTTETNELICQVCGTEYDKTRFYRYCHCIDKCISDGDTTYFTPDTIQVVKNAASLVCQMVEDIADKKTSHGFAIIRPPGHHASHLKSSGFCIVNNIAVGANYAVSLGYKKIFIFDFDAHHGNGTQQIFYYRSDVFYCSMHSSEAYPQTGLFEENGFGAGTGYNLNILVKRGTDSAEYLDIFRSEVLPTILQFGPELIMISAGFDGLETDPMAIFKLTPDTYGRMINSLLIFDVPICMVLEGGYDLENLEKCYDTCIAELLA